MSSYTFASGGKRLRPLIILLVYEINTEAPMDLAMNLAVAFEIMHSASLIHDDIVDEATERRGLPSLYMKYGLGDAIVTGDYLFSVAYRIGASYGKEISEVVSIAAKKLAEGQIEESSNLGNFNLDEDTYMRIISNKTASLFASGSMSAALLAECGSDEVQNMYDFAYNIGMAFQIADDVLDIVGKEEYTGKPPFTDMKHSALTLPMIYALKHSSDKEKRKLLDVLSGRKIDNKSIEAAKEMLIDTGSVDYCIKVANSFIDKAIESQKHAKLSPNLQTLFEIAYSIVSRVRI
jgi:Geranylgeranyl pyrophosphate synthase